MQRQTRRAMDKTQALFIYASSLTQLKKSGARWVGLCPVHKEKTGSFWIDDDHWRCYGCGQNGTVFDLWMLHNGFCTEPLDKEGFLAAKKALGFWDYSKPEPIKKGPPKPHFEKVFKPVNKKDGWTMAVSSLRAHFDQEIIWKGKKYWNFQFICECIRPLSDEEIQSWIIKIVGWFKPGIYQNTLFKNMHEYLGRVKK